MLIGKSLVPSIIRGGSIVTAKPSPAEIGPLSSASIVAFLEFLPLALTCGNAVVTAERGATAREAKQPALKASS